jgi:hypothetical protein
MKRIGMTLAAVLVGGVLLTTGEAKACESHRAQADAPAQREKAAPAEMAPAKVDPADALHAAKCQCGSAADCTCKKGTCECPKCKKPKRDVAPLDASAGLST